MSSQLSLPALEERNKLTSKRNKRSSNWWTRIIQNKTVEQFLRQFGFFRLAVDIIVNRERFVIGGTFLFKYAPVYFSYVKACFHYGCALRCVARDIETPIVFLFLSPRATQRNVQQYGNRSVRNRVLKQMFQTFLARDPCSCIKATFPTLVSHNST